MNAVRESQVFSDAARRRRGWGEEALARIEAEAARCSATPLVRLDVAAFSGIEIYLKDESSQLTGSLKHRLARSLFVHALCSGEIGPETTIFEASSGSTAVSEAYFAGIVGVPFVAVLPSATSREKIELIEHYGGTCHPVDNPAAVSSEAKRLASEKDGYFMDQFAHAAQATDWRSGNIAEELFAQLSKARRPFPTWIVVGAGTGGTSTSIARYTRFKRYPTMIAVVDPEGSAFYEGWRRNDRTVTTLTPSRIEGIGRTSIEPSFYPGLVDVAIPVPDAASIAAMRWCSRKIGRRVGASTGTNVWGTLQLAQKMRERGETGSLVTLICDSGDRYGSTYYNDEWLRSNGIDGAAHEASLERFELTGRLEDC